MRIILLVGIILPFIAGALAISNQSLWIDEAHTALKATAKNFSSFFEIMRNDVGSDTQMPLYMLAIWIWEKVIGSGEYALRAFNIPAFVGATFIVAIQRSWSWGMRYWFVFLACVSPMVWTYLDEARPYIFQFLGTSLVMASLVNLARMPSGASPRTVDAVTAATGAIILCGASLLGVIFTFFFGAAFVALWLKAESPTKAICRPALWGICAVTAICLAGLACYYVWTLNQGARASSIGRTNVLSLLFCGYELLGISGVGPGRLLLREGWAWDLLSYIPGVFAYVAAICLWVIACLPSARRTLPLKLKRYAVVVVAVALSLVTIVSLGVISDFRVLGRHLIPLLPFGLLGISALSAEAVAQASYPRRLGVFLLPLAMLISALCLRFSPTHAKDDYRGAATAAKMILLQGKTVWWAADGAGASYYSLHPIMAHEGNSLRPCTAYYVNTRSFDYLQKLSHPDVVILSKPDIYDPQGALRVWLMSNGFAVAKNLPAFAIWEKLKK